jgi:hypothetical protein
VFSPGLLPLKLTVTSKTIKKSPFEALIIIEIAYGQSVENTTQKLNCCNLQGDASLKDLIIVFVLLVLYIILLYVHPCTQ